MRTAGRGEISLNKFKEIKEEEKEESPNVNKKVKRSATVNNSKKLAKEATNKR